MPHYYGPDPDAPEEKHEHRRKCDGMREDLLECIMKSSCVKETRKSPRACLVDNDPSVESCQALAKALMECKRSLIDMRRRFRGPKGY